MVKILDNAAPTIEEVKDWGNRVDVIFIEQDEDLILHDEKFVPALMELASDILCPKSDYCLSILTHFTQIALARRTSNLPEIEMYINQYSGPLLHDVANWKSLFLYLHNFITNPQEISEATADNIAFHLTVGNYCSRNFEKLGRIESYAIEYLASTISYKEYFYIDLRTAYWRSSKYTRLDKMYLE